MIYSSEVIGWKVTHEIIKDFYKRLRQNELEQGMPKFLTHTAMTMSLQYVHTEQMPVPNFNKNFPEDPDPINIACDAIACGCIDSIEQQHGPVFNETAKAQGLLPQRQTQRVKRSKKDRPKQSDTADSERQVFALSEPVLNEEQLQLQRDIDNIKKRLYFIRRLRKENEQEQQKRLEESQSRKGVQMPQQDFAYDFSGQFLIKQRPKLKQESMIRTGGKSLRINGQLTPKSKLKPKALDQYSQSERDYLVSRGTAKSREGKRMLYGNMGKRQVSHLPFINLSENSKLSQNHRSSLGQDTSRLTLKSYQSRGESNFKSYAEIEKQKSNQFISLKRSSVLSEVAEDGVMPLQVTFSPKRQSKRMQKYLNKLYEDKSKRFVSEINKSCNFDRQNSPHNYSVHRYYRHDFNEDKRSICESSLASLKINTSMFRQVKVTQ